MEGIGVTLPAGVLQQDSAIIDEQDSYLVLTVRVSKETIRKNHALLMALSDMTSEAPWSPATDPPTAIQRKTSRWPYAAVTFLALVLPLAFQNSSFAGHPPHRWQRIALAFGHTSPNPLYPLREKPHRHDRNTVLSGLR